MADFRGPYLFFLWCVVYWLLFKAVMTTALQRVADFQLRGFYSLGFSSEGATDVSIVRKGYVCIDNPFYTRSEGPADCFISFVI